MEKREVAGISPPLASSNKPFYFSMKHTTLSGTSAFRGFLRFGKILKQLQACISAISFAALLLTRESIPPLFF